MSLQRWDPFSEMTSLRQAMDRLMEEAFVLRRGGESRGGDPVGFDIDVLERDDALVVRAALPGVKPEDVDIQIEQHLLTIRGELREERESREGRYHLRERRLGRFARSIALPGEVDTNACEADFENGLLTITLPKTERARSRPIPIRGARTTIEGQLGGGRTGNGAADQQTPVSEQLTGAAVTGQEPGTTGQTV